MLLKSIPQKPVSLIFNISIILGILSKRHLVGSANGLATISSGVFMPDIKHHHRQYRYENATSANIAKIMQ